MDNMWSVKRTSVNVLEKIKRVGATLYLPRQDIKEFPADLCLNSDSFQICGSFAL